MNVTNQGNNFDGDSNAARPVAAGPDPRLRRLMGLAIWFALAVWSFAGSGVTDYLLFIVYGFPVALPLILSRVWRADGQDREPSSLHDWAESDFETWQDPALRRASGASRAVADWHRRHRHDGVRRLHIAEHRA